MNAVYLNIQYFSFFSDAQEQFECLLAQLKSEDCCHYNHRQLERHFHQ